MVLHKYGIPPVLVQLIQSLHEGMKAAVTTDSATNTIPPIDVNNIDVNNGLRQGCTIAPSLFNLYFNLVVEEWRRRCQPFGVDVLYKCGGRLVGRQAKRASKVAVTELQFADDAVLVGATRESIVRAAHVMDEVTSEWGLTMSIPKTKLLVTGAPHDEQDWQPIDIRGESIEVVSEFRYLGAVVEIQGEIVKDVEDKIARASRAFGALCKPVFRDGDLSNKTKRMVYRAAVLGVLLYGAETWANKRAATRKIESFHNKCLRRILNITRVQQWAGRISSAQVRMTFGMKETLEETIAARRLRWLGHIARMDEDRMPKRLLFGWLPQRRPAHGTKLRWKDKVRRDFQKFHIDEDGWYSAAQDRGLWRAMCRDGLSACAKERLERDGVRSEGASVGVLGQPETTSPSALFVCDTCHRSFRRRQDIARHKCQRTRDKGRQVIPRGDDDCSRAVGATGQLVCNTCGRSFRRKNDISRHKCQTIRHRGGMP